MLMFNNKEQIEENQTERFLSRENCKLKLEVGRRVTVEYSFFFSEEKREDVLSAISLINQAHICSEMKYNVKEISTKNHSITKLELILGFENCMPKGKECFLDISKRFVYVKSILDMYSNDGYPKSFRISCLLAAKNLQRENNKKLKEEGVEIHNELLLLGHYSKYTTNVNYDVCVYKYNVHFMAYSGNINKKDYLEIYYEIINELLNFNDNCIC